MGGVEIERADTGESLMISCSGLSTLGGEMLRRPWTIVVELVGSCRPIDRLVRTEAGEGAVATGGSDGDLKRMAGYPSVVVMSVFWEAIGKKGRTGQKSVMCLCNSSLESQNAKAVLISRGECVQFYSVLFMSCSCRPRRLELDAWAD